jgi:ribosome-associated heat shock protein Hsp15
MQEKETTPVNERVRLDKWLKVARLFKTRSAASRACETGRVAVNDQKAKPAKPIKVGDRLTIRWRGFERKFLVRKLASKSIKAALAAMLYRELEPETASGDDLDLFLTYRRLSGKVLPKFKGRPTKKERRKLTRMRGH